MKKIKYFIDKGGKKVEVEGEQATPYYGIHRREDKMYALTHIASGYLVASTRLKKELQLLASDPAFFDPLDPTNKNDVYRVACAVQQFVRKNGWK